MSANKICQKCKNKFCRKQTISNTVWKQQKYCSLKCSALSRGLGHTNNVCPRCKKKYRVSRNDLLKKRFLHCSISCASIGRKKSKETIEKMRQSQLGDKGNNWKGGKRITSNGYVLVYNPEHPNSSVGKCVMEHRLVMERKIGRFLTKNEQVHHKNGIKDDNRIENLEIVIKKMHFGKVLCPHCLKSFKVK